jgi:hypothetical protein
MFTRPRSRVTERLKTRTRHRSRTTDSRGYSWGTSPHPLEKRPRAVHLHFGSSSAGTPVCRRRNIAWRPAVARSSAPALQRSSAPALQRSSAPALQRSSAPALRASRFALRARTPDSTPLRGCAAGRTRRRRHPAPRSGGRRTVRCRPSPTIAATPGPRPASALRMARVMPDTSGCDPHPRPVSNRDSRSRRCGWSGVGVANSSPHPARTLTRPGRCALRDCRPIPNTYGCRRT